MLETTVTECPKCLHCRSARKERERVARSNRSAAALHTPDHAERMRALSEMAPHEVTEWFSELDADNALTVIRQAPESDREAMLTRLSSGIRDQVRVGLRTDFPPRVRLTSETMSYRPRPLPIDRDIAVRLNEAGLDVIVTDEMVEDNGHRPRRHPRAGMASTINYEPVQTYAFAHPFELDRGMRSCVLERRHFDLCVEVDPELARLIKLGAVTVTDLDDAENRAYELALLQRARRGGLATTAHTVRLQDGIGIVR